MTCLDDDQVLRVLQGEVLGGELTALDRHLDGCPACRALIGATGMMARGSGGEPAATDELDAGERLGRYVIEQRLGAGAMGVVYAARDPELHRTVAIKLLRPERGEDRGRLLREAQVMARVQHPNIVAVHDVGARGDQVYVAMELVDGPTLRTWAAARTTAERLDAVLAIGRALAAAHQAGVIHRDVKPDNVLVGADGRPRLGDFGLARPGATGSPSDSVSDSSSSSDSGSGSGPFDVAVPPLREGAAAQGERYARMSAGAERGAAIGSTSLTATGAVLGTPAYMAPEQLRGEPATVASDQFSFAVTAWETLAGTRPFVGDDLRSLTRAITIGPSPQRQRELRSIAGSRVTGALLRALAAAPADRFDDVAALVAALTPPPPRRHRATLATIIIAAAAAAVTVVAVGRTAAADPCILAAAQLDPLWTSNATARAHAPPALREQLDRATARWRTSRLAVCRAARTDGDATADVRTRCLATRADELAAVMAAIASRPGDEVAAALAALADPDECATSPALALFAPVPPADRAAIAALQARITSARMQATLGGGAAALPALEAAVADADRAAHRPTQAAARLALAETVRALGRYRDADREAEAAALDAAAGHDDLTAARAWLVRVGVAGDRRDLGGVEGWLPHAASAVERAGAPGLLAAQLANGRGLLALGQGRLDDAARELERALTLRESIAGADVEVARTRSALGHVARLRGDLAIAERQHRAALAIDRVHLGDRHPDVGRDLHNLGGVLRLAGDLEGAEAAYREALANRAAALGARHPEVALTHNSLGLIALERGDADDAQRELELALAIFTDAGHLDRAIALANLARVAALRGDHARALSLAEQAIALDRAQLPPRHERLAGNLVVAAGAAAAAGDRPRARELVAAARAALPPTAAALAAEVAGLEATLAPPPRPPVPRPHAVRKADIVVAVPAGPALDAGAAPVPAPDAAVPVAPPLDARPVSTTAATDAAPPTRVQPSRDPAVDPDLRRAPGVYGSAQGWD